MVTFLAVGCASDENQPTTSQGGSNRTASTRVTSEQLAENDGKAGNKCYVAVSGRVYEITNSSKWVNGIHTESEGQASCGRDLTEAMDESPHGVSILTTSPRVKLIGNLE